MLIFLNYIKVFLKSLLSQKWGSRDFLLIGVIGFLLIRINSCSPHTTSTPTIPILTKVEHVIAKDKTTQSVIPQTVYTQSQMKVITKSIAKNLGINKVHSVTKDIVHLDIDTTDIPAVINDSTITTSFSNKDINVTHVYNTQTKTANFGIHLSPDTVTYVEGTKTKWFKPDEYTIHINHSNDLMKDDMGSSYTFKEGREWLVIGPSVGMGVGFANNKFNLYPSVGITATIPIIRFKKKR